MDTVFTEYSNQHDSRKYPFVDDATMSSINGSVLPTNYIRDIFVYPIDTAAACYIQTLNVSTRSMTVADTATGNVLGSATWVGGDTDAPIYEIGKYGRQIGIVVFGSAIGRILPEADMVFTPAATTLVSTCAVPLIQEGVRGLLCNDQLLTGIVSLVGVNGVNVRTFIDTDGKSILRIDAVGSPPPQCPDKPIDAVLIINEECAAMLGSMDGHGSIFLTARTGWTALNECRAQLLPDSDGNLPEEHDGGCVPTPPIPPIPCNAGSSYVVSVIDGKLSIMAPGTLDIDNPFKVDAKTTDGEPLDVTLFSSPVSVSAAERRRTNMMPALLPIGQIVISVKGH